jgi:hypothetical protein
MAAPRSSKPFAGRCELSWVSSILIHPRHLLPAMTAKMTAIAAEASYGNVRSRTTARHERCCPRQRENDLVQRLEREHGSAPIKLGTRPDTWSGLSDRDLLSRVWGEDERYSDYADMSNASHANVAGIWHSFHLRARR